MTEIGNIALILALIGSVYSIFTFLFGGKGKHPMLVESGRNTLLVVCGMVTLAVGVLVFALLTHNYQIEYVASYTSNDLSASYLISALWAGNDGSILFWAWLLSICGVIVVLQKRDIGKELTPYASAIIMFTEAFFLVLLLFIANPFKELNFVPTDGQGLNPMLNNPGMLFHPPFLLAGYVTMTVPFAFAISALLTNRLRDGWIITIRRWTILAWLFLSIGNIIGSWWAYVELGWGGYWAWDPVENASFMPWLTSTAFLHSTMMQRRRGILKSWNMVLIIVTFCLTILGTFLTRSGILSSVHTFSESPLLGFMYLGFLSIVLFGSLGLVYYRSEQLKGETEMESLVSRESTFLLNNLLLVGAAFAVLLGTFFPIISEAVRGAKVSVGPPFYNQVMSPIFLAIILLAGVCTLIGWRRSSMKNLVRNFALPAGLSLLVGIGLFIGGIHEWLALIALTICSFVLFTIFYELFRGIRARHSTRNEHYLKAFWRLLMNNRPRYGGYLVHIGVILFAIGVIGSSVYNTEAEQSLTPGDTMTVDRYSLTYENLNTYETASKDVVGATLSIHNGGHLLGKLTPEKYYHRNYQQSVSEVAIRSTFLEDLYVILVGWDGNNTAAFKVIVNPLVNWLWIGGLVLVAGGVFAFWPESKSKRNTHLEERIQTE